MKTTILLLFFSFIQVMGSSSYSQNTPVSLNLNRVRIDKVLNEIENQSDYYFLYNEKLVNVEKTVDVNVKNEPIKNVLTNLFSGTNIDFVVVNNQILLSPQNIIKGFRKNIPLTNNQQKKNVITGTVTDEKGEALPGVNIFEKGTKNGTITNSEGMYSIQISSSDVTLVFSFIGYKTNEVPVTGKKVVNVILIEEAISLEEVVTVGYGTQKKLNLTGSVAKVDAQELMKQTVTSAAQAIQGRASGIEVVRNNGAPGAGATIRIRGLGTFGNSTPLVLIDGIEGDINMISPQEIESVNILKDASACAIYGTRAANGVIIINTKEGKSGSNRINYSFSYGINRPIRIPGNLNAKEFAILQNEALINANKPSLYTSDEIAGFGEGTNWVEEVLQTGIRQNHNLQFLGGNKNIQYALIADILNETGIVINSWYKRYNLRLNLGSDITDWMRIGFNSFVSHSKIHETPYAGYESPLVVYALQYTPTISPKVGGMEGTGGPNHDAPNGAEWWAMDPVTYSNFNKDNRNYYPKYNYVSSFFAEFKIMEGLKFKTTLGFTKYFANNKVFYPSYTYYDSLGKEGGGSVVEERLPKNRCLTQVAFDNYNYNITNLLTYIKTFDGGHYLKVLLGHNDQLYENRSFSATAFNFPSNDLPYLGLGTERQSVSESATHWSLRSFFSRINYDYQGRYLMEFSVRRDASSKFSEKYRWGTFPSGSVGWRISDESFMEQMHWLDNLKIRASYGVLGGQDIGVISWNTSEMVRTGFDLNRQPNGLYESYATMNLNSSYPFNHTYNTGAAVTKYANPNIKWEVAHITDIGIDMSILNGKLTIIADYYSKITKDLILPVNLPMTTGIFAGDHLGSFNQNVGEMKNTGFEYTIHYFKQSGDFKFDIRYSGTHMHNEILKLQPGIDHYFLDADYASQHKIGEPYGAVSGFNIIGVYQTQEQIDERLQTIKERGAVEPGDYIYDDTNNDGIIDGNDVIVFGSPLPSYVFGLTANASYKGFDFNIHFQGDIGKKVAALTRGRFNFSYYMYLNNYDYILNRWTGPGSTNKYSRVVASNINYLSNNNRIQDASYAKIRNIELGYTLPVKITRKAGIQQLRVFCNVANLAYFTKYVGFEVERTGSYQRTDVTPQARTTSFGVNVQF